MKTFKISEHVEKYAEKAGCIDEIYLSPIDGGETVDFYHAKIKYSDGTKVSYRLSPLGLASVLEIPGLWFLFVPGDDDGMDACALAVFDDVLELLKWIKKK